jgi:N-acetylglutamate synthase
MDGHGMSDVDLVLTRSCEERIVNCWPAVETLLIGDFVVRLANGYSSRANSASPIRDGAQLSDSEIDVIEGIYRDAGLKPCAKHWRGAAIASRIRPWA